MQADELTQSKIYQIEYQKALKNGNSVTCISTQIVEAGWDVSFQCVIRSMAGLDNLIQAAGRCNRNGIGKTGTVYLIQMNDTAEKVTSLPEIRKAQQAMRQVLNYYYKKPEHDGERLDSEKIIERYYTAYLMDQSNFCYPVKELQTDIVDLLSDNKMFQRPRTYGPYLRQAFQSAGQAFSLIEEKGGIDVVVPYGDAVLLLSQLDKIMGSEERIQLMRKLQRYNCKCIRLYIKKNRKRCGFPERGRYFSVGLIGTMMEKQVCNKNQRKWYFITLDNSVNPKICWERI